MPFKSQFVLWYAGLRGAIAYALAKRWGGNQVTQAVEGTTIILVLLTTFILGSTVGTLVQKLQMEMGEDDEFQLNSIASLEQYWQQSAFATEGNDTAATELRTRSTSTDNVETLVEEKDKLSTKAHSGFLNIDENLKKWIGGRPSTKAGVEADLAEELSGPGEACTRVHALCLDTRTLASAPIRLAWLHRLLPPQR
jgi:phage-related protein